MRNSKKRGAGRSRSDPLNLLNHHPYFKCVSIKGSNAGCSMTIHNASRGINVYVCNNVQGVTNSVLVGSDVRVGDGAGVRISLPRRGKKVDYDVNWSSGWWLVGFLLLLGIAISLFLLQRG